MIPARRPASNESPRCHQCTRRYGRKDLADFNPAFAIALELVGRPHDGARAAFGDEVHALEEA